MTLYELNGQYLQLLEMAEEETFAQVTINDTLEGLEGEIEEKADSYACVIKSIEGNIETLEKEMKRLEQKKSILKNNVVAIKRNLESTMLLMDKKKIKTNLFSFNIQRNPATVIIDDANKIPQEYFVVQEPKIDKSAIKEYLKNNSVDWAHLNQTESLRIR